MSKLTLDQHLVIAYNLAIAAHHLDTAYELCLLGYTDKSRLIKKLGNLLHNKAGGSFLSAKSILDDDFLQGINNKDFRKYGYIYHNLESLYKLLQEKNDTTN